MIWSKQRFQHSFELFPQVLKEVAPLLFPLSVLLWGVEFYMAYLNKARFEDPYGSSMTLLVVVGIGGVILQCFSVVVWYLCVARSTQRQMKNGTGPHPFVFLREHFHQTLIEYIRAFVSSCIYALCLIIPGIFRWLQLIFVCLVSAFDPEYQKGNKNALKESARLVKGAMIPLLFLLLLQMSIPFMVEEYAKGSLGNPIVTVLLYLISWLVSLYFAIYFSLTFFARWSFKLETR